MIEGNGAFSASQDQEMPRNPLLFQGSLFQACCVEQQGQGDQYLCFLFLSLSLLHFRCLSWTENHCTNKGTDASCHVNNAASSEVIVSNIRDGIFPSVAECETPLTPKEQTATSFCKTWCNSLALFPTHTEAEMGQSPLLCSA